MSAAVSLVVERVNPLEHEQSIKALFAQEGSAGAFFAPFFDRAYEPAVAEGAWSWVGRDPAGTVVMHVACFPHRFLYENRVLMGGLGVNLMVTRQHRTLFPALSLLRCLVADARKLGFDFLYVDPNPPGRAVFKAVGFGMLGQLERYAMPLAGRDPIEGAAVLAFRALNALRGVRKVVSHRCKAVDFDTSAWALPTADPAGMVPIHSPSLYPRRLAGYPTDADFWFTDGASPAQSTVAVLVRTAAEGLATICAIRRRDRGDLPGIIRGVAHSVRSMGAKRLQARALVESSLSAELRRGGLMPRCDSTPILAHGLSDAGNEAVIRPGIWQIMDVDCDRGV